MASSTLLLALTLIFVTILMPISNVAESPSEVYWRSKLGSDTLMPKIVEDALLDINDKQMIRTGMMISEEEASKIQKDDEEVEYMKAFKFIDQQQKQQNSMSNSTTIDVSKHSTYFMESDLTNPGKKFNLNFIKIDDNAKFLPIKIAKSIPFSSNDFPRILKIFSTKPNSTIAEIMEDTIKACETKEKYESIKYCAVTFEDMVDFVASKVGKNRGGVLSTLSGYVDRNIQSMHKLVNAKKIKSEENIICHKMVYPYAIFYCHVPKNTNMYEISMVDSETGKKMEAIGVCHEDTSLWDHNHISFRLLKVKPGSVPVCHFLNERSIAFVVKK